MNSNLDLIHMIANAGLMVQFVMLLLLLFSIASWGIILIKHLYMRKAYRQSAEFTEYFWKSRSLSDAYGKAKQLSGSPIARVFLLAYVELRKISRTGGPQGAGDIPESANGGFRGAENVQRALRRAGNTELTRMTQMVPFLATTGNTAPFIGLFGTVWGIMNSFHNIGQRGTASLAVVAPGISEALVATAAGLAVAIPAVIAYNYFMQKIRILDSELQSFSADFLNIIERDLLRDRKKRG